MKKTALISALALSAGLLQGQITIAEENFDTLSTWTNDIASQTFVDPTSSDQGLFIQQSTFIGSGNTAFARDLAGETGEPSLSPFTFTFASVDISGLTGVTVGFDFYAFANADSGSYELIIDGVATGTPVVFWDDPDTTAVQGRVIAPVADSATSVGLVLRGTQNGTSDVFELDNFTVTGFDSDIGAIPEPSSMSFLLGLVGISFLVMRRRS